MSDLITQLTNFFNLTKLVAITLPGLIGAAAVALIAWPPAPGDYVTVPLDWTAKHSTLLANESCHLGQMQLASPSSAGPQSAVRSLNGAAVSAQAQLDTSRAHLVDCITVESSAIGNENIRITALQEQIKIHARDLDTLERFYHERLRSNSRLAGDYLSGRDGMFQLVVKDSTTLKYEINRVRGLQLHVDQEKAYLAQVDERLKDPGRLRPRKTIDEIWQALTNHVIAFLMLALGLGMALDPISRAIGGFVYSRIPASTLNWAKPYRRPVVKPTPPPAGPPGAPIPPGVGGGGGDGGGAGAAAMPAHAHSLRRRQSDVRVPFDVMILEPEFAIGQQLLTQLEYDTMRGDSYQQSQIAFGSIPPLVLMIYALNTTGRAVGASYWFLGLFIGFAAIAGVDRLHKFYSEVQALIAGRYAAKRKDIFDQKALDKQKADDAAAAKKNLEAAVAAVTTALQAKLDDLKKAIDAAAEKARTEPSAVVINNTNETK